MISHVIYIGVILLQFLCCFVYKYRSEHDMFTGLYTKDWLLGQNKSCKNRLICQMEKTKWSGEPFGLLMIDIDGMKNINDRDGHVAGDLLLSEVSDILKEISAHYGTDAVRFGGDEMLVLCSKKMGCLRMIANDISIAIKKRTQVTASIGGATFYRNDEINQEKFMEAVDSAMYQIKNNGKDGVNII